MQEDADGRNIYAKAYNFNGSVRMDADGNPTTEFRVNSHINGKHSYPSIAMDMTGGFVVTWESLNQVSKTSGYDIYLQRYDSSCTPIGGVDSIQAVQFNGDPSPGGTFQLRYVDEKANIVRTTQNILIGNTDKETAQNIKAALTAIGLEVEVGVSNNSVLVQFIGDYGSRSIAPLIIVNPKLVNQKSGQSIIVTQMTTGASGETLVNDTTVGDKRYPSMAMAVGGEFIVTWTSWGQGNDSSYESNIYAKNFPANDVVATRNNQVTLAERIAMMNAVYNHRKLLMAADSPDNHVTPSDEFTGVVYVFVTDSAGNSFSGTGSLLTTGMHILTAAHVVFDDAGSPIPAQDITVRFDTASGSEWYNVSQNYVHPTYTGVYAEEVDLAVLTLERLAPLTAQRYDIYRGGDELGSVVTLVGYGRTGTGWTGNVIQDGLKRSGQNRYEAYGTILDPVNNPNTLVFDFDNGFPQNDFLGYYFGIRDLGLGMDKECSIASGDSGGPGFIDGKIAGVCSYGGTFTPSATDVTPALDSSFGEYAVEVRVSAYADWIDAIMVTGGAGTAEYLVNQTETGNQIWSDVAIGMNGDVVFTWTSFNQDYAGDGPGGSSNGMAGVYARRFNFAGTPVGGSTGDEFLVNDYIVGDQRHSSVSMANNGDFMIVWESWQDKNPVTVVLPNTGFGIGGTMTDYVTDFGIYAKRFTNLQMLMESLDHASTAQYGLPDNTRFIPGYGYVGIHGEIGSEFHVNREYVLGDQTGVTLTLNGNGDAVVVFQSNDSQNNGGIAGSETKVYYRALPLHIDRTAPVVTETLLVVNELIFENGQLVTVDGHPDSDPKTNDGVLMPVRDGSVIYGYPTHMVVTFSEEMYHEYVYSPGSVLNPANWQLFRNGVTQFNTIVDIQFQLDMAFTHEDLSLSTRSGKYEAVITFANPLKTGDYMILLRDNMTDLAENNLDGNYDGTPGGNFARFFQVMVPALADDDDDDPDEDTDHSQGPPDSDKGVFITDLGNDKPAIASSDDGSYVVVAVHYGMPGTLIEPDPTFDPNTWDWTTGMPGIGNIIMQRYDRNGNKVGMETVVNSYLPGHQTDPDVAMDSDGNIAVVWSGYGPRSDNGVYLQLYGSNGNTVGTQIWVNEVTNTVCSKPKVAYDTQGNVVVTWLEYSTASRSYVVMARAYDNKGALLTKTTVSLIAENNLNVNDYDIAFTPDGKLIATWQIHNAATNSQDIYAKVLQFTRSAGGSGNMVGTFTTKVNTFLVNQYTSQIQARPAVATSASGTFVITWASERQAGLKDGTASEKSQTFDVYARRFDITGKALPIKGTTGDFLVCSMKTKAERLNPRDFPDVAMAPNGSFVITWSSYDQEPLNFNDLTRQPAHDYGAFARAFDNKGNDLVSDFMPFTSTQEFRMNFTTLGNQMYSVATIWDDGMSFAWVGEYTLAENDPPPGAIPPASIDVFSRAYTGKTRIIPGGNPLTGNTSNRSAYSLTQPNGGGGYSGVGKTALPKYEN
ncbi:MAG: trypsin-like serine protease, partial [Planctomycetaceae bacterium]|nr:trypsin-like serine protease [Planctomycetaceae bacterium]